MFGFFSKHFNYHVKYKCYNLSLGLRFITNIHSTKNSQCSLSVSNHGMCQVRISAKTQTTLTEGFLAIPQCPSAEFQAGTFNYVTTSSLHTLYNILFLNHLAIRRYIV
jgi:hypothetical protein